MDDKVIFKFELDISEFEKKINETKQKAKEQAKVQEQAAKELSKKEIRIKETTEKEISNIKINYSKVVNTAVNTEVKESIKAQKKINILEYQSTLKEKEQLQIQQNKKELEQIKTKNKIDIMETKAALKEKEQLKKEQNKKELEQKKEQIKKEAELYKEQNKNNPLKSGLEVVNKELKTSIGSISSILTKAGLISAAVGVITKGIKEAVKISNELEQSFSNIIAQTDQTDYQIGINKDVMSNLYKNTIYKPDDISKVMIQSIKSLDLEGQDLEDVSKALLDFSKLSGRDPESIAKESVKAINSWEVKGAKEQIKFIETIFKASQQSSIEADKMLEYLSRYSDTFNKANFEKEEVLYLLASLSKQGFEMEGFMPSMRQFIANMADIGVSDPKAAIYELIDISNDFRGDHEDFSNKVSMLADGIKNEGMGKTDAEILSYMNELFGRKRGVDISMAMERGDFDTSLIQARVEENLLSFNDMIDRSKTTAEEFELALKPLKTELGKIGDDLKRIVIRFSPFIKALLFVVQLLIKAFGLLAKGAEKFFSPFVKIINLLSLAAESIPKFTKKNKYKEEDNEPTLLNKNKVLKKQKEKKEYDDKEKRITKRADQIKKENKTNLNKTDKERISNVLNEDSIKEKENLEKLKKQQQKKQQKEQEKLIKEKEKQEKERLKKIEQEQKKAQEDEKKRQDEIKKIEEERQRIEEEKQKRRLDALSNQLELMKKQEDSVKSMLSLTNKITQKDLRAKNPNVLIREQVMRTKALEEREQVLNNLKTRGLSKELIDQIQKMGLAESVQYGKGLMGMDEKDLKSFLNMDQKQLEMAKEEGTRYGIENAKIDINLINDGNKSTKELADEVEREITKRTKNKGIIL